MKVHELIKLLQEQDQDANVLLSIDPAGNRYNHLDPVMFVGNYEIKYGEINIGYKELTPDLLEQGYTKEDTISSSTRCIVLYPTS